MYILTIVQLEPSKYPLNYEQEFYHFCHLEKERKEKAKYDRINEP